jgi:hypothetical protein
MLCTRVCEPKPACAAWLGVQGAIGRIGRTSVPVAGLHLLRLTSTLCRALGVGIIVARLTGTLHVAQWRW